MQKTESQLSGTLYRKGTASTSPWTKFIVNVQISSGVMKFFVEKEGGENVMMSQVNVKKGKFTLLDDSVGRSFAFEILIEELIGKSGNAKMTLAAEDQSDLDGWKEGFELCFNTAEKKTPRRSSSVTTGAPPPSSPARPTPPAAPTAPGAGPPAPPKMPSSAPGVARAPPVKPTMPTRNGSAANLVPPTPPGSANRSVSPRPPARPKPTEPTPAVSDVPPPVPVVEPAAVANEDKPTLEPVVAPTVAPRSVSPPPPAHPAPTTPAAVRSVTPPPPTAPRSISPPPPARPNPNAEVRSISPPPPSTPAPAPVAPVVVDVPVQEPVVVPIVVKVESPTPVKAESPMPIASPPNVVPVIKESPKEKSVSPFETPKDLKHVRTNSVTMSPFSTPIEGRPRVGSNASLLFQQVDDETPIDDASEDEAPKKAVAVGRGRSVTAPPTMRTSPESVDSDYSDEVSDFDVNTLTSDRGHLERGKSISAMEQSKDQTIAPKAVHTTETNITPLSINPDDGSISGPNTASPMDIRKTVSQSAPTYEMNSPVPSSSFASQPNTPNSALAKINASANKYKVPKFKNLLNSNGIDPEKEREKEKPVVTEKKKSAADLNRIAAEEEALLPPIIYKKIRTSLRRRELNINVRPTENIRMGYLAKLDTTSKHQDEDAWMSQFVSFNIQTGIFTHFAEINGRRIPRGKYDMNSIDIYTIDQVYRGKLFSFKLTRSVPDEKGGMMDELLAAFAAEDLQMLNYWLISFEDFVVEQERLAEVKRINSEKQLLKQNSKSNLTIDANAPVDKKEEVSSPQIVSPSKMSSPSIKPKNSVRDTIKTLARNPSFHFPKSESPVPEEHEEPPPKEPSAIEAALLAKKSNLKTSVSRTTSADSGDDVSPSSKKSIRIDPVAVVAPAIPVAAPLKVGEPTAVPQVMRRPSVANMQVTSAPATPLGTSDHKQFVELDLPNTFNALNKLGSANQSMFGEPVKVVDLDDLDKSLGLDNMSSIVSPIASQSQRPITIPRVPTAVKVAPPLGIAGIGAAAAAAAAAMAARVAANSPAVAAPTTAPVLQAPSVASSVVSSTSGMSPASTVSVTPPPVPIVAPPKVLHSDITGMKLEVQSVKYPAARLARRIKIWYCSSGFSLASEEAVRQFVHELRHTGDDILKSFADEKFDNILDWANLLEVLRKYELKLRLESPENAGEDQFVTCKVAVTVPSRSGPPTLLDLSENMTIAEFAEKLAKEFKLPVEDLLTHLPVMFTKTVNPHQQSLNLLRDDLTFAEDLILYQEEVIDHLWDSYSIIKNLVEQRDDVINQLYSQISELKESKSLTMRDDMFNGGLGGSPTNIGLSGQRLQYNDSPRKRSTAATVTSPGEPQQSNEEDGDVTISREEWRNWMEEKHKLILQHNETKSSLVSEIRLLRKSLNPSTEQTYLEMKKSESARARLEEELVKAQIQNDALKTELAVCKEQFMESESEKMLMESDWMERLNSLAAQYEDKLLQQFAEHQQDLAQRSYFAAENSYLQPELQNDLTENNYYMRSTIDHDATNNPSNGYNFSMELRDEVHPAVDAFNSSGQSFNGENATLASLLQSTSFAPTNGNRTPPVTTPTSTRNSISFQQDKSQWIQQYAESHALLGSSPAQHDDFPAQYRTYSNQGIVAPEMDNDLMELSMYRSEYRMDGHDSTSVGSGSMSRRASAVSVSSKGSPQQENIRPRTSSNDLRNFVDNNNNNVKTLPQATTVAAANNKLSRASPNPGNKIIKQPEIIAYDMSQIDSHIYVNRNQNPVSSEHPLRAALRNDSINRLGGQNKALPKVTRPQFPFHPRNDAVKQAQQQQLREQEAMRSQPGILPSPIGRSLSPNRGPKIPSSPHKYLEKTDNWKNRFNSEKQFVNPHIVDRHSGGWKFT